MILGDKSRFAIEFQIDRGPYGIPAYGYFCFWAGGERLGYYDVLARVDDIFTQIHGIVKDCGKRHSKWIDMDAKEVFYKLYEMIYLTIYDGETYDDFVPAAYDVRINTESFDGFTMFLLDCDILTSRLIYSDDGCDTVKEVRLVPGEFDSVIKRFYIELDKLCEEIERLRKLMNLE